MKTKNSKFIERLLETGEITINPNLDTDDGKIYFPEKVRKAKEVLAKGKLPQAYYDQIAKQKKENEK